jgi:lauroyl/myristoyl acyltransferase
MAAGATTAERSEGASAPRLRLKGPLLRAAAGVLQRLPAGLLHRAVMWLGALLYFMQPARRRLVKANLRRVCRYLVDAGLANDRTAAAARDERALAGLARAAFGHYLRGYLEGAILPAYARAGHAVKVEPDVPSLAEQMLATRPLIIVGLHFGAIEIPALWASQHGLAITTPMETVADPDLQEYLVRSRGATGLRVIPLEGAARELVDALRRQEVVAVVADRAVGGKGVRVDLFGAPARLPLGPAVLAVDSGTQAWLVASRRVGPGQYRGHLELIAMEPEGTHRDRVTAFLAAEARAFERAVAAAPEQWWTVFFPIWPDIT